MVHGGSVIPHPFAITLFEHSVYYTDWTKMAVMKANKYSDNSPQELYRTSQRPHGLTMVHAYRQPFGKELESLKSGTLYYSMYIKLLGIQHQNAEA